MTTRLLFWFPAILAVCVGAALIVVGNATAAPISQSWLGFCGSIIGSAFAAGTGYWLIVVRENREIESKYDTITEAINEIADDFRSLQGFLRQEREIEANLYYRLAQHNNVLTAAGKMIEPISPSVFLIVEVLRTDIVYDWKRLIDEMGLMKVDFNFNECFGSAIGRKNLDVLSDECETSLGNCRDAVKRIRERRRAHAATPA